MHIKLIKLEPCIIENFTAENHFIFTQTVLIVSNTTESIIHSSIHSLTTKQRKEQIKEQNSLSSIYSQFIHNSLILDKKS